MVIPQEQSWNFFRGWGLLYGVDGNCDIIGNFNGYILQWK